MNENIDLTEILKDCPKGTKLYSSLFGDVEFKEIDTCKVYPVNVKLTSGLTESFTRGGKLYDRDYYKDTECVLFPSKEQRDWSKFKAPWYKKEKFDLKMLKAFDKVMVRDQEDYSWQSSFFSHLDYTPRCINGLHWKFCIPFNDETKHLLGTKNEAPEFYRYWED